MRRPWIPAGAERLLSQKLFFGMKMRPSSFRALIFALAMVVQTVAGGWSVAHAAAGALKAGVSTHCAQKTDVDDDARDARHGAGRHMCESCCLCAGPPSVSVAEVVSVFVEPRAFTQAGLALTDAFAVSARIAQARLARGPPAASRA